MSQCIFYAKDEEFEGGRDRGRKNLLGLQKLKSIAVKLTV